MDLDRFGFTFNGQRIDARTYGDDYIPAFVSVLERFAPARTERVLEWGSGLTTQILVEFAERRWQSRRVVTLDEFAPYQEAVLAGRPRPAFLDAAIMDQIGRRDGQHDRGFTYSTYPLKFGEAFDLIFIDGRRRMECALIAAHLCHPDTVVVLHDWRRTRYQPILSLFRPLEDGPQFRVLAPRKQVLTALAPGIGEARRAIAACEAGNA